MSSQPSHSERRVAIVTGSAQGIGLSIAHRLFEDGFDVVLNDIHSKSSQLEQVAKEIVSKGFGREVIAIPGDVSVEEDVKHLVDATVKQLGGLDVMIANAGIAPMSSFLESTTEQMDQVFAVNVRGTMLCFKYAAMQMIAQGRGGRLIAASSAAGKQGTRNLSIYSASKFAIRGLTQTSALELGKYGITVNAYAPGIIHTPLALLPDGTDDRGATAKRLMGFPPETPDAEPEVIASAVSYLCKPEAHFITGQTLSIDGGLRLS